LMEIRKRRDPNKTFSNASRVSWRRSKEDDQSASAPILEASPSEASSGSTSGGFKQLSISEDMQGHNEINIEGESSEVKLEEEDDDEDDDEGTASSELKRLRSLASVGSDDDVKEWDVSAESNTIGDVGNDGSLWRCG